MISPKTAARYCLGYEQVVVDEQCQHLELVGLDGLCCPFADEGTLTSTIQPVTDLQVDVSTNNQVSLHEDTEKISFREEKRFPTNTNTGYQGVNSVKYNSCLWSQLFLQTENIFVNTVQATAR